MAWERRKDWYLAPTAMDAHGSVQLADARGRQVILPGMLVHIGHNEEAPVECLVGIPLGATPAAGWTPLDLASFPVEFARLFGRASVEAEYMVWE